MRKILSCSVALTAAVVLVGCKSPRYPVIVSAGSHPTHQAPALAHPPVPEQPGPLQPFFGEEELPPAAPMPAPAEPAPAAPPASESAAPEPAASEPADSDSAFSNPVAPETEPTEPVSSPRAANEPAYAHGSNYVWLLGQLQQVHSPGGDWKVRYAPLDRLDRWGGSMILAQDVRLDDFADGDLVYIEGEIINERPSLYLSGPLYRLRTIRPATPTDRLAVLP